MTTPGMRHALLFAAALAGIGIMLYPSAASWLMATGQNATLASHSTSVANTDQKAKDALFAAARAYNRTLPQGPLLDPYSPRESELSVTEAYLNQLKVPGDDVLASVRIASIGLNLPIYRGTAPATLDRGAGHLFGSSLPVGGRRTHSVITAHAGLPEAEMFTRLAEVRKGETFAISVLGKSLYYRVDRIETVVPTDLRALKIVDGKDYVTLVTCTPINVNSHRLLVRGVRVAAPIRHEVQRVDASAMVQFPWWAVTAAGLVAVSAVVVFRPGGGRPRRSNGLHR